MQLSLFLTLTGKLFYRVAAAFSYINIFLNIYFIITIIIVLIYCYHYNNTSNTCTHVYVGIRHGGQHDNGLLGIGAGPSFIERT